MIPVFHVLVLVWPNGRFRVSSEQGVEDLHAFDETLVGAKEAAAEVVNAHHLPLEGGSVQQFSLWPWEEVARA
jgi:hypothetical protein